MLSVEFCNIAEKGKEKHLIIMQEYSLPDIDLMLIRYILKLNFMHLNYQDTTHKSFASV